MATLGIQRISNGWVVSWITGKQTTTMEMLQGESPREPKTWYFPTKKALTEGMPGLLAEMLGGGND